LCLELEINLKTTRITTSVSTLQWKERVKERRISFMSEYEGRTVRVPHTI